MVKLKNYEIRDSLNAIRRLDEYKLSSGRVTYQIARNLATLRRLFETVEEANKKLIKDNFGENGQAAQPNPQHPNWQKFQDQATDLLLTEVELDKVFKVKLSELKPDENAIHATILEPLFWMIEDEPTT